MSLSRQVAALRFKRNFDECNRNGNAGYKNLIKETSSEVIAAVPLSILRKIIATMLADSGMTNYTDAEKRAVIESLQSLVSKINAHTLAKILDEEDASNPVSYILFRVIMRIPSARKVKEAVLSAFSARFRVTLQESPLDFFHFSPLQLQSVLFALQDDSSTKELFEQLCRLIRESKKADFSEESLQFCEHYFSFKRLNQQKNDLLNWLDILEKGLNVTPPLNESKRNLLHSLMGRVLFCLSNNTTEASQAKKYLMEAEKHYLVITSPADLSTESHVFAAHFYHARQLKERYIFAAHFFRAKQVKALNSKEDFYGLKRLTHLKAAAFAGHSNSISELDHEVKGVNTPDAFILSERAAPKKLGEEKKALFSSLSEIEDSDVKEENIFSSDEDEIEKAISTLAVSEFDNYMKKYKDYLDKRSREMKRFPFGGFSEEDYRIRLNVYMALQYVRDWKSRQSILAEALVNKNITGGRRHECLDVIQALSAIANSAFDEVTYEKESKHSPLGKAN